MGGTKALQSPSRDVFDKGQYVWLMSGYCLFLIWSICKKVKKNESQKWFRDLLNKYYNNLLPLDWFGGPFFVRWQGNDDNGLPVSAWPYFHFEWEYTRLVQARIRLYTIYIHPNSIKYPVHLDTITTEQEKLTINF